MSKNSLANQKEATQKLETEEAKSQEYLDIANQVITNSGIPFEQPEIDEEELVLQQYAYGIRSHREKGHMEIYLAYLREKYLAANLGSLYETTQASQFLKDELEDPTNDFCVVSAIRVNLAQIQIDEQVAREQIEQFDKTITPLLPLLAYFRREVAATVAKHQNRTQLSIADLVKGYEGYLNKNPLQKAEATRLAELLLTESREEKENAAGDTLVVGRESFIQQIEQARLSDNYLRACVHTPQGIKRDLIIELEALSNAVKAEIHLVLTSEAIQRTEEKIRDMLAGSGLNHRTLLILIQAIESQKRNRNRQQQKFANYLESKDDLDLRLAKEDLLRCSQGILYRRLAAIGFDGAIPEHAAAQKLGAIEGINLAITDHDRPFTAEDIERALLSFSNNGVSKTTKAFLAQTLTELGGMEESERIYFFTKFLGLYGRDWKKREQLISKPEVKEKEEFSKEELVVMGEHLVILIQQIFSNETLKQLNLVGVPKGTLETIKKWSRTEKKGLGFEISILLEKLATLSQNIDYRVVFLDSLFKEPAQRESESFTQLRELFINALSKEEIFDYLKKLIQHKPGSMEYDELLQILREREGKKSKKTLQKGGTEEEDIKTQKEQFYYDDGVRASKFAQVIGSPNFDGIPRELAIRTFMDDMLKNFKASDVMGYSFAELIGKCIDNEAGVISKAGSSTHRVIGNNSSFKTIFGGFRLAKLDEHVLKERRGSGTKYIILGIDFFEEYVNWLNQENNLGLSSNEIKELATGMAWYFEESN